MAIVNNWKTWFGPFGHPFVKAKWKYKKWPLLRNPKYVTAYMHILFIAISRLSWTCSNRNIHRGNIWKFTFIINWTFLVLRQLGRLVAQNESSKVGQKWVRGSQLSRPCTPGMPLNIIGTKLNKGNHGMRNQYSGVNNQITIWKAPVLELGLNWNQFYAKRVQTIEEMTILLPVTRGEVSITDLIQHIFKGILITQWHKISEIHNRPMH